MRVYRYHHIKYALMTYPSGLMPSHKCIDVSSPSAAIPIEKYGKPAIMGYFHRQC